MPLIAYHTLYKSVMSYILLAQGHSASKGKIFASQRRATRIVAGFLKGLIAGATSTRYKS